MANVSWVCPTIHPDLAICDEGIAGPLDRLPRRRRDAPRRRDDAPRGDAHRPDGGRPVRGPGARRGAPGPRSATTPTSTAGAAPRPGATIARGAPRWTTGLRTGGAPNETDPTRRGLTRPRPSPEDPVAERPHDPAATSRPRNGWDREYETYTTSTCRPTSARSRFMKLPWIDGSCRARGTRRRRRDRRRAVRRRRQPPLRRPVRAARDPRGAVHVGLDQLAPARRRAVRGPDRRRCRRREHRPGLDRARPRDDLPQGPRGRRDRRDPDRPRRRPLDHLAVRDRRRRGPPARAASASSTSTPTPTPPTTTGASARRPRDADAPAHRVRARSTAGTSSRSGLRGYWPPAETFDWMREQGLRWHFMREIEERGAEAVIAQAIDEALDGPDAIYLSLDIDVIDPGMAPGTGTPEPGGMLTREVLRAVRQIVGAVELAGMDIVEVSPPYDQAETTAMAANRAALEAITRARRRARTAARPVRRRARVGAADRAASAAHGRAAPDPGRPAARARAPVRPRPAEDPGDLDLYRRAGATGPAGRSSSWPPAAAASPSRSPTAGHARHRASTSTRRCWRVPATAPRRAGVAAGRAPARRGGPAAPAGADAAGRALPAGVHRAQLDHAARQSRAPAGARCGPGRPARVRAASPSSTCGCPTPRTSLASTAGSSSSGSAGDPGDRTRS